MDSVKPPLFDNIDQDPRTPHSQQEIAARNFYLQKLLEEASRGQDKTYKREVRGQF